MKKFTAILLFIVLSFYGVSAATGLSDEKIESFRWLEGTWRNMRTGDYEQWRMNTDSHIWEGRGFRIAGEDTSFTERLIIACDGDCHYIADVPHNPEPVRFKITEITETGFHSENPGHDFPKFIKYELESDGRMRAIIGAGDRTIRFEFQKTAN